MLYFIVRAILVAVASLGAQFATRVWGDPPSLVVAALYVAASIMVVVSGKLLHDAYKAIDKYLGVAANLPSAAWEYERRRVSRKRRLSRFDQIALGLLTGLAPIAGVLKGLDFSDLVSMVFGSGAFMGGVAALSVIALVDALLLDRTSAGLVIRAENARQIEESRKSALAELSQSDRRGNGVGAGGPQPSPQSVAEKLLAQAATI